MIPGVVAVATSSLSAAQSAWIVDVAGAPDAHFTQVQPAIDGAVAGDRIIVRPGGGFYDGFTVSKGVSIICELRGWAIGVTSDIIIRDVPAGERVDLKRFVGYFSASLILEDNLGVVHVEKSQNGRQLGGLVIRNCAHVSLNETPSEAIRIESSYVTINRGMSSGGFVQDPLMWAARSVVVLGNSVLVGSRANYNGATCQLVFPPGRAIDGHDSVIVVGAGSRVLGGRLNVSGGSCPPISMETDAIRGTNMHVIRDPAATVSRVGPGVSVQVRPVPTLDGIVGDELNGRMDFDLIGTPGSATALFATLSTPPSLTPYGFQWADLRAYVVLDVGLVDAMGHRTLSVPLPSIYPIGEALVFQSIVLDQGQLFWSTPSVIVIS